MASAYTWSGMAFNGLIGLLSVWLSATMPGVVVQAPQSMPAPTSAPMLGRVNSQLGPATVNALLAEVASTLLIRSQAATRQKDLSASYESQLKEIDRLKRSRASWRRDRQLRQQLAASLTTAEELAVADLAIRKLDATLRDQRTRLLLGAEAEAAQGPAPARMLVLQAHIRSLTRILRGAAKKIVVPDDRIDPLADPEELDYQASLLRRSEQQLRSEVEQLQARSQRYYRMDRLAQKRARAAELSGFDDDRRRRRTGRSEGTRGDGANEGAGLQDADDNAPPASPSDSADGPGAEPGSGAGGDAGGFEGEGSADPVIVLADVVDAGTLDALRRAVVSNDPLAKARAADLARQQVKARLERLVNKRRLIEKRAQRLRRGQ